MISWLLDCCTPTASTASREQQERVLQLHGLLTDSERALVQQQFSALCAPGSDGVALAALETLDSFPRLVRPQLAVFAWRAKLLLDAQAADAAVSFAEWLAAAAILCHGTWTQRAALSHGWAHAAPLDVAQAVACAALGCAFPQSAAAFVVTQNQQHLEETAAPTSLDFLDAWAPQCPLFATLWEVAFLKGFGCDPPLPRIPQVSAIQESDSCLLGPAELFILSHYIKRRRRRVNPVASTSSSSAESEPPLESWPLIYSSRVHGKAWGSLMSHVESVGSIVLILKDASGAVFGAFVPTPLDCSPKFVGNQDAFLFSIVPEIRVFCDAGVNRNHVYFNYGMSTLPNGIGFGGQLNYFGLFIDSSLSFGSCSASPRSSTFHSPCLSSSPTFEIDEIQVLLVEPKEVDDRLVPDTKRGGGGGASILNSNPLESALLEMAGKERYHVE